MLLSLSVPAAQVWFASSACLGSVARQQSDPASIAAQSLTREDALGGVERIQPGNVYTRSLTKIGKLEFRSEQWQAAQDLNTELSETAFLKPESPAFASGNQARGIPFELRKNFICLEVRVNRSQPLKFILDSGWGQFTSALSQESARALGLSPFSYTDPNLSADYTVKAAHVQELRTSVREALGSLSIPTDGLSSLSYDTTSNRITTAGFAYDAAGNQVRALKPGGGSQRFRYDAANRMVQVLADDNSTVIANYIYGDSRERLIADEGGYRTYFDCEGGATIAEYYEANGSTTPSWSKSYVYLGNRLLSTLVPNGSGGEAIEYHHPDRLGTRLVTNPATGGSFEQVTLPFGTVLGAESTGATNRRFTSYDRSATSGLDYANNRHYDSQQGRFTQVDPAGMKATSPLNPQTLNLYAYCTNDPINRTDPNGLGLIHWIKKHWKIILVAVAVVVAVLLIPGAPALLGSFFQNAGHVILTGAGAAAAEGGGIPTWVKVVFGGAIAAGIFALGLLTQRSQLSGLDATEAVKKAVNKLLKSKACKNFLDSLLARVKTATGVDPIKTKFSDVFKIRAKNPGFYDGSGTIGDNYGLTELRERGLSIGIDFSKSTPTGINSIGITAIHEVLHAAASRGLYSHFDLAKAAYDLGRQMGLVPDGVLPPKEGNSKEADDYNSQLLTHTIYAACKPQ